ncbi:C13 family peptidase [Hydrogenophaga sp. 5NK40-0174]|uniref:C13 family peptidase n=1 Tax=Hydrogenophaga sp. 5NK40-0174 TaxID=3127649 RepID=UPI003109AB85
MNESVDSVDSVEPVKPTALPDAPVHTTSAVKWIAQGLRGGIGLRIGPLPPQASWIALVLSLLALNALNLANERFYMDGEVLFSLSGFLYGWAATGLTLLAAMCLFASSTQHHRHAQALTAWFTLLTAAHIPILLVSLGMAWLYMGDHLSPVMMTTTGSTLTMVVMLSWVLLVNVRAASRVVSHKGYVSAIALLVLAIMLVELRWLNSSAWEYDYSSEPERPRLELSQELFERQQALLQQTLDQVEPSQPGDSPRVYALFYAPYNEDVFLRESRMMQSVAHERMDAEGRTVTLLNHPTTADSIAWATPRNLKHSIEALASKMNREQDVLLLYLTSHGGRDHRLASYHWPLEVPSLTAIELKSMLDTSGIKYRSIAVSACYSGGWVPPLEDDNTLVLTASDKDHTSYGCGNRSDLTYFGRAMFDEGMRETFSWEAAFVGAVERIKRREEEGKKRDGFSNPQMSAGQGFLAHWDSAFEDALSRRAHQQKAKVLAGCVKDSADAGAGNQPPASEQAC